MNNDQGVTTEVFVMEIPQSEITFNPEECRAAMVTCK